MTDKMQVLNRATVAMLHAKAVNQKTFAAEAARCESGTFMGETEKELLAAANAYLTAAAILTVTAEDVRLGLDPVLSPDVWICSKCGRKYAAGEKCRNAYMHDHK